MNLKIQHKPVLIIGAILLCILTYSFITESLLSMIKRGQTISVVTEIIGFLIVVKGTALMVYGGYLLFIRTVALFLGSKTIYENIGLLRNPSTSKSDKRKIRKENINLLIETWKPSFVYLILAPSLIVIGAILINIAEGTIVF
ncbi:MAG: hypothetical protein A2W98_12415 [Bacteroidetes bacterium GWF2_33_38]|nr:MAG: hypothetical protein A2W98_12415 [Bacteroidetes bacterium GWF2_33_38]OFY72908.1 MAG: hypothetical protein A2265_08565 [Bacteroidetes bacterium RIFOXYA12_FULL_33_9]OFY92135.1 MAG: hypothetical protein A2236_01655 [Bacteroidetes bacterium RIFOXYA2_FULL_33_7]